MTHGTANFPVREEAPVTALRPAGASGIGLLGRLSAACVSGAGGTVSAAVGLSFALGQFKRTVDAWDLEDVFLEDVLLAVERVLDSNPSPVEVEWLRERFYHPVIFWQAVAEEDLFDLASRLAGRFTRLAS